MIVCLVIGYLGVKDLTTFSEVILDWGNSKNELELKDVLSVIVSDQFCWIRNYDIFNFEKKFLGVTDSDPIPLRLFILHFLTILHKTIPPNKAREEIDQLKEQKEEILDNFQNLSKNSKESSNVKAIIAELNKANEIDQNL
ncbi:MAG: hypothetical protein HeimC3_36770 [Candidatus Heimdallarchaeota archaeon LC_3]|nr:MAG: hypothetical protein HeimC3_36770 [Candidatus Heimdallarchaeota archaeon LC_3]